MLIPVFSDGFLQNTTLYTIDSPTFMKKVYTFCILCILIREDVYASIRFCGFFFFYLNANICTSTKIRKLLLIGHNKNAQVILVFLPYHFSFYVPVTYFEDSHRIFFWEIIINTMKNPFFFRPIRSYDRNVHVCKLWQMFVLLDRFNQTQVLSCLSPFKMLLC